MYSEYSTTTDYEIRTTAALDAYEEARRRFKTPEEMIGYRNSKVRRFEDIRHTLSESQRTKWEQEIHGLNVWLAELKHERTKEHSFGAPTPINGVSSDNSFFRSFVAEESENTEPAVPFPVNVLPGIAGRLVREGAAALGAPPDFVALPLLASVAGIIGNNQRIELKPGFVQHANIWTAAVGHPGSVKSPAQDTALAPLNEHQREAREAYLEAKERYEDELNAWLSTDKDLRGTRPEPPKMQHYYVNDVTLEALNEILEDEPGITMARDELVSFVKSCDAYRGGRGGDRQAHLSHWAGAPIKIDRKGKDPIFIPDPVISICGGVQPDMLPALAEEAGRRDGFIERFLWAFPDPVPMQWTEDTLDQAVIMEMAAVFHTMRQSGHSDAPVRLSPDAKHEFVGWFGENAAILSASTGLIQGFAAKLPNQLARLALILHCLHHPKNPAQQLVSLQTMRDAINLVEFFRSHAYRVLPLFGATGPAAGVGLVSRVRRILKNHDGDWVTRTTISEGLGRNVPSDDITEALQTLEEMGEAETQKVTGEHGGRPREEWRYKHEETKKRNNRTNCAECGVPLDTPALQSIGKCRNHLNDYEHAQWLGLLNPNNAA